jgi:hypothetical protein
VREATTGQKIALQISLPAVICRRRPRLACSRRNSRPRWRATCARALRSMPGPARGASSSSPAGSIRPWASVALGEAVPLSLRASTSSNSETRVRGVLRARGEGNRGIRRSPASLSPSKLSSPSSPESPPPRSTRSRWHDPRSKVPLHHSRRLEALGEGRSRGPSRARRRCAVRRGSSDQSSAWASPWLCLSCRTALEEVARFNQRAGGLLERLLPSRVSGRTLIGGRFRRHRGRPRRPYPLRVLWL